MRCTSSYTASVIAAAAATIATVAVAGMAAPHAATHAEPSTGPGRSATLAIDRDDSTHKLVIRLDERELLTYDHDPADALPHIWPLRGPSGRPLTVQHPDPYPHHRSVWIADKVQLGDGPVVDFYHCWQNLRDAEQPELGHRHAIRHRSFDRTLVENGAARVDARLQWMIDDTAALDEHRVIRVQPLEGDDYLLELEWELVATNGPVTFHSDWVHYAWPYVRMHPVYSGDSGGTIVSDSGATGQAGTNERVALWIDYTNAIDGVREGLAVFAPDDGEQRKWLTREYGCFGPRRPDRLSGTAFTLAQGESLAGRAAILVHRGDVAEGRVAERYRAWAGRKP